MDIKDMKPPTTAAAAMEMIKPLNPNPAPGEIYPHHYKVLAYNRLCEFLKLMIPE